jgi:glycerate kinase
MSRRILLAFNPFKGTLTAAEVAAAVAAGLRRARPTWRVESLPVADGGPGTLEALRAARGGRLRYAVVAGPLGRPVRAAWLDLGAEAVLESAQAVGLERLRGRRDAGRAHSIGLGSLLLQAARAGKRRVWVGLGGSACTDGGTGLARALGWRFEDAWGRSLPPGGAALERLARVLPPDGRPLGRLRVVALCDVDNPLFGRRGAAYSYAPQKGASPALVRRLDRGLRNLAARGPAGPAGEAGAGAAGGLGYGLRVFAGADLRPGAASLLKLAGLAARLSRVHYVLTGEGRLDAQSLRGKLPVAVAAAARKTRVPCVALCGRVELGTAELRRAGFTQALEAPGAHKAAARRALQRAAEAWARRQA